MTVFSNTDSGQPRSELVLPWTLVITACLLAAVATANKTTLSLVLGGPMLAAGGLLMLASLAALGDKHTLVTDGPYRWVRHPFYLGLLVMLAGAVIATWSLAGALLFVPALILTLARARREEHTLRLRFGARYDAYRQRVPFILPIPQLAPPGSQHDRGG